MSTLMQFEFSGTILQFEAGGTYPAGRSHEVLQVSDRSAGGSLQVETLGITIKRRTILFELMSEVDYVMLLDFFIERVNASEHSFYFTDEYGQVGEVKFINNKLDFKETSLRRYSGEVTLEYV